jgi:Tol biopolymer transport system component
VIPTLGFKHEKESGSRESPRQVTNLPKGSQIGSITVSPDGSTLLYTLLSGSTPADFRSQIRTIRTDGTGGESSLSDGRSLDLFPVFTPGGDQIVFSSNRFGRRLSIVAMNASGAPGITSLTSGDNNDLWPTIDSDPRPRLFYQSMVDTRAEPRLFTSPLDAPARRTDITATPTGALQPRIGPTNDWVLFSSVNEKTGKRDVFRVPSQGGPPQNLTNSPETDDFDPVWSKDGNRIAFVSDRARDTDDRPNYDIWVLDLSRPGSPVQITDNPAHDDMPLWDPAGGGIYFRSNRKGEWQVWRIPVK